MNVREEIKKHAAPGDRPALLWLFDRYHWDWQWRFVAKCEHVRYGHRSYETNRKWSPTEEGWVLFENSKEAEMGKCQDCKHWSNHIDYLGREWHTCEGLEWLEKDEPLGPTMAAIYAEAADDYNMMAGLFTGPLFGCTNFKRT